MIPPFVVRAIRCRAISVLIIAGLIFFTPSPSQAQVELVEFPAVGPFNGFNNHFVVVECASFGSQGTNVQLNVRAMDGTVIGSKVQGVPAYGSSHYILNSIANIQDRIGTFELVKLDSAYDTPIACNTIHYRRYANGVVNYALGVPVRRPLVGDSWGTYNSHDPENQVPTKNWLTIFNPNKASDMPGGSANFKALLRVYKQDGKSKKVVPINLGPGQRVDIELGTPEGQFTGLYKIDTSDSTPYESFLARYNSHDGGQTFRFGLTLLSNKGTCNQTMPISSMGNGGGSTTVWLELANTGGYPVTSTITVRGPTGLVEHTEQRQVAGFGMASVAMNPHIDPSGVGNMGTVTVECEDPENQNLVMQTAHYGRTGVGGPVSWAYISQGRELPIADSKDVLVGAVNTFSGAENWVGQINHLPNVPTIQVSQFNQVGGLINSASYQVAALGIASYDAHSVAGPNVIGTVALGSPNSLPRMSGELNRVYKDSAGNIVEVLNTPLALIRDGLPCLGGACVNADFAGRSDSLQPYRENLSSKEVLHLLRKVALGADDNLYDFCLANGLSPCLLALQNYQQPFDVEAKAMAAADREKSAGGTRWSIGSGQNWWLTHLRYGDPLRAKASLILHDHIATSIDPYDNNSQTHHFVKQHVNLLWNYSLGNFRSFVKAWLNDNANGRELDFVDNHAGQLNSNGLPGRNENGPREYFELLLMGAVDPFTGEDNYTENDVQHGFSDALSGFVAWSTSDPDYAGIAWDEGLWYGGTFGAFEVFAGTPFHTYAIFDYQSFTDYVMQVHTQPARYLAYTYASRLTGVAPTSQMVTQLAAQLRASDYNLKQLVVTIAKSHSMFSKESRQSCIGSPAENLMYFMRRLNLPLEFESRDIYDNVRAYLFDTGHALLDPPTVFGFGECFGHSGPSDGSSFLSAQRYIEGSYRNFRDILNRIRDLINDGENGFTYAELFPVPGQAGSTPSQIADHLIAKLGCEFTQQQRNALVFYLSDGKDYSSGNVHSLDWNPDTNNDYQDMVDAKLAGAVEILFAGPCGSLR